MPCYDHRTSEDKMALYHQVKWHESVLCAIFNELERRGIEYQVINAAEKNGTCNILDYWLTHKKNDHERVIKKLQAFSEDEKNLLRSLLNG